MTNTMPDYLREFLIDARERYGIETNPNSMTIEQTEFYKEKIDGKAGKWIDCYEGGKAIGYLLTTDKPATESEIVYDTARKAVNSEAPHLYTGWNALPPEIAYQVASYNVILKALSIDGIVADDAFNHECAVIKNSEGEELKAYLRPFRIRKDIKFNDKNLFGLDRTNERGEHYLANPDEYYSRLLSTKKRDGEFSGIALLKPTKEQIELQFDDDEQDDNDYIQLWSAVFVKDKDGNISSPTTQSIYCSSGIKEYEDNPVNPFDIDLAPLFFKAQRNDGDFELIPFRLSKLASLGGSYNVTLNLLVDVILKGSDIGTNARLMLQTFVISAVNKEVFKDGHKATPLNIKSLVYDTSPIGKGFYEDYGNPRARTIVSKNFNTGTGRLRPKEDIKAIPSFACLDRQGDIIPSRPELRKEINASKLRHIGATKEVIEKLKLTKKEIEELNNQNALIKANALKIIYAIKAQNTEQLAKLAQYDNMYLFQTVRDFVYPYICGVISQADVIKESRTIDIRIKDIIQARGIPVTDESIIQTVECISLMLNTDFSLKGEDWQEFMQSLVECDVLRNFISNPTSKMVLGTWGYDSEGELIIRVHSAPTTLAFAINTNQARYLELQMISPNEIKLCTLSLDSDKKANISFTGKTMMKATEESTRLVIGLANAIDTINKGGKMSDKIIFENFCEKYGIDISSKMARRRATIRFISILAKRQEQGLIKKYEPTFKNGTTTLEYVTIESPADSPHTIAKVKRQAYLFDMEEKMRKREARKEKGEESEQPTSVEN